MTHSPGSPARGPLRLTDAQWRRLPKAELHVHLEGVIDLPLMQELCRGDDPPLLADGGPGAQRDPERHRRFRGWLADVRAGRDPREFHDFPGFLDSFAFGFRCLRGTSSYARLLEHHLERCREQGIVYTEVMLSPMPAAVTEGVLGEPFEVIAALGAVRQRWAGRVDCQLIVDMTRNFGPEAAWVQLEAALAGVEHGVVGLGLGGLEAGHPVERFSEHFLRGRDGGLRLTCHAGETDGPASVRAALDAGAERIGHGARAIEDPDLVLHLATLGIPLEVSPTSNLRIGVVPSVEQHPFPSFAGAGVELTVNSDDPGLFGSDLAHEFLLLRNAFGLTAYDELCLVEASFRHAFLPHPAKEAHLGRLREVFVETVLQ
ncbi:MAG: adenosine deaminase family protein [Candidatus Dormibacteria bacterium]